MILMESHLGQPQSRLVHLQGLFHQLCSLINQLRYMSKLLLLLLSSNHLGLKKLQLLELFQLLESLEQLALFQFLGLLVLSLQLFLLLSLRCCFEHGMSVVLFRYQRLLLFGPLRNVTLYLGK